MAVRSDLQKRLLKAVLTEDDINQARNTACQRLGSIFIERYSLFATILLLREIDDNLPEQLLSFTQAVMIAEIEQRDDDDLDFVLISKDEYHEFLKEAAGKFLSVFETISHIDLLPKSKEAE